MSIADACSSATGKSGLATFQELCLPDGLKHVHVQRHKCMWVSDMASFCAAECR